MKTLIFAVFLTFVASFGVDKIPQKMRERLDRFVSSRSEFHAKWISMSHEEMEKYERIFNERLQNFPPIDVKRIHDLVETKLSDEQQHKLRGYLEMRFFSENDSTRTSEEETNVSDLEMIDLILKDTPRAIRDRIHTSLKRTFEEATVSGRKVN